MGGRWFVIFGAVLALIFAVRRHLAAAWVGHFPLVETARCDTCGAALDEDEESLTPHICDDGPEG